MNSAKNRVKMKKLLKLTTKNGVFKLIAEDIKVFKAVFLF